MLSTLNAKRAPPVACSAGCHVFLSVHPFFPSLPHTERRSEQNERGSLQRVITGWVTGYLQLALHFNHSLQTRAPATEIDFKMGQWNVKINTEEVKWLSIMINAYKWSVIQKHTLDRLFILFREWICGLKELKFVYMATRLTVQDFIITH